MRKKPLTRDDPDCPSCHRKNNPNRNVASSSTTMNNNNWDWADTSCDNNSGWITVYHNSPEPEEVVLPRVRTNNVPPPRLRLTSAEMAMLEAAKRRRRFTHRRR